MSPLWAVCSLPLLRVRSWLHPFKGHCEQKAMRDEGVIYVAGHPLLNRRCTKLPGCFYFPKRKLELLKARYSLTVLKVPLNSNQSINLAGLGGECVVTVHSVAFRVLSVDLYHLDPHSLLERSGSWQGLLPSSAEDAFIYTTCTYY